MALQGECHDRLSVELRNSDVYEGDLIWKSAQCIELDNIFCPATNTTYDGSMTFYRNEIARVVKLSEPDKSTSVSPTATSNGESFDSCKIPKISMDLDEFNRLRQMTNDFIFIDTFSSRFDDAVRVLSNRESVAVVGLGNTFREKGLSLLLMADFKQVYIFDMLCLVHLKGLQQILESSFICKVVHDGAALYDSLSHRYKVQMNNVFDIKIVDEMISRQDNQDGGQRNIGEILTHYFNFPPSLIAAAMDDMHNNIWADRPVAKSDKIKAANLVTYLFSLRDKLMAHILNPYNTAIQNSYVQFKSAKPYELS